MFSRLSTRGDALFLIDLLERRIDAEMVVLSACNSGQVFSGEGDDLSGVAHGFLAAGAKRLVASIWRVHDQATRDWMATFYREMALARPAEGDHPTLASTAPPEARLMVSGERDRASETVSLEPSGHDVGEMLRRACVQTREMWDHPFFWGAFCLYG